jgi:hypothetical protein
MTIQFTTDLNKTIRWTENEAEAVLRNFIAADKSTHWIHTDLTVEQTNIVSKIVWTILSILPSIRNWLFDVNLDKSLNVLHLLKTQIQDENADLKALFNQAVDHFAELSPKRFNPETTSKENFYIESSILSGLNPATSLARPDFSISLSAIYNPLINDLDLQESSEDSDAPLASTPAVEVPYYKSFELNGSKIFLRACDKTLSNDITTIRFQRSRKDTITLLNQGDLQIIEASVPNQNSYKVHKGDELVESFKKSLSD